MKLLLTICLQGLQLAALGQTYEEEAVAAVLMGEAWCDGVPGMTAVAEVVHQRAIEKGLTPLRVVTAHRGRIHAFSCLNGRTLEGLIQKYSRETDYQQALKLAHTVCQAPAGLPGLTKSANHFTRSDEHPAWAKGKEPVAIVGRHAFYRLEHY